MAGLKDFPKFGALSGLKILDSGSNIAGPFAGGLLSEAGATVIHFEAPKKPDNQRGWYGYPQNHRNQLSMVADIKTEEGREIFLKLIKWADIWVESSKGGQYDRLGLPDDSSGPSIPSSPSATSPATARPACPSTSPRPAMTQPDRPSPATCPSTASTTP